MMTLNEYQQLAMRTRNSALTNKETIVTAALGLPAEAGEVADIVKKWVGQGHPLDKDDILIELGDILWYIALMATALDTDLDTIGHINVAKLERRYAGDFSAQKSVNRYVDHMEQGA